MKERDHFKAVDIDGENDIKLDFKEIGWQSMN
jgi:hypothetical protein